MARRFTLGNAQDLVQAERDIRARIGDSELDFAGAIKLVAEDPETLGTAALGYAVTTATRSANPGAVYHAKALLKQVTGLDEDNPGFWIEWWNEYLPEHAGE